MMQVDQTDDWKENGAITKLDLYYSWNHGCLQGVKATYGNKASNAKIIGHEKNLYTQVRWKDDLAEEQSRRQATAACEQWKLSPQWHCSFFEKWGSYSQFLPIQWNVSPQRLKHILLLMLFSRCGAH